VLCSHKHILKWNTVNDNSNYQYFWKYLHNSEINLWNNKILLYSLFCTKIVFLIALIIRSVIEGGDGPVDGSHETKAPQGNVLNFKTTQNWGKWIAWIYYHQLSIS
jgi:hypothetical protein